MIGDAGGGAQRGTSLWLELSKGVGMQQPSVVPVELQQVGRGVGRGPREPHTEPGCPLLAPSAPSITARVGPIRPTPHGE